MWPWGHLAVGYLLYSAYTHHRYRVAPGGLAVVALALGTQFPDLIDKPLAWTFHLLPSGRSLAHSLFAATAVTAIVVHFANRHRRSQAGLAFGIGYASHLVTDGISPFLHGDFSKLTYLGWPLLPEPDYGTEPGFIAHFVQMEFSPELVAGFLLAVLACGTWIHDGTPGLGAIWATMGDARDRFVSGR